MMLYALVIIIHDFSFIYSILILLIKCKAMLISSNSPRSSDSKRVSPRTSRNQKLQQKISS